MEKPEYELGPLKAAVIQARMNIAAFERGILKEEEHIRELENHIKNWEKYNEWVSSSTELTG